jgi:hypothetical protein
MSRTHDVTISAFDLDRLEREVINWKTAHDIAIEQRDRAQSKIENQAERIKYLEGATNHATGTPLSKMREQRDRLAEALKDVMKYRKGEEPYDYWRLPESHRRNVQFDGWNEIENRINAALAAVKGGSDE